MFECMSVLVPSVGLGHRPTPPSKYFLVYGVDSYLGFEVTSPVTPHFYIRMTVIGLKKKN